CAAPPRWHSGPAAAPESPGRPAPAPARPTRSWPPRPGGCASGAPPAPGGSPPPPVAGGGSAGQPGPPRTPAPPRPRAAPAAVPGSPRGAPRRSSLPLRARSGRQRGLHDAGQRPSPEQAVGVPAAEHPLHVAAGLGEGNLLHPPVQLRLGAGRAPAAHRPLSGVVAGEREGDVSVEALEQPREVRRAELDVGGRVLQLLRGGRADA